MMKQTFQHLPKSLDREQQAVMTKNDSSSIDPETKQVKPVKLVLCSAQFSGEDGRWTSPFKGSGREGGESPRAGVCRYDKMIVKSEIMCQSVRALLSP